MNEITAQETFMRVKDWAEEDRPREKLSDKGLSALTDTELLAIILRSGSSFETVVSLSRRMLSLAGNSLDSLGRMTVQELTRLKGMGPAKAMSIVCAFELGRRRAREESPARFTIGSSKDVYQFCSHLVMDIPHEEMYVILLNRANVIIGNFKVSQGGISAAVVDIRLILKPAIESLASGIILVHNHPSGNLNPSREDKQVTTRLKEAAKLMDISLLDHLIIAGKLWFSFADEGIL